MRKETVRDWGKVGEFGRERERGGRERGGMEKNG